MVTEEQERELERRQSRLKPKKKSLAEQERELEAKQTRLAPRYKTKVDASLEMPTTFYSAPRSTTLSPLPAPPKPSVDIKKAGFFSDIKNKTDRSLKFLATLPQTSFGRTPLPANKFGGAMSVPIPTQLQPFLGNSIDPTIGTLIKITGIPYIAGELNKIPNVKELKDASWLSIAADYGRGAVAVSPPLLGYTFATDVQGGKKWSISPTKTDAERMSLPFGDILFRSKEDIEYLQNKPITDSSAQTIMTRIGAGFRPIDAALTGIIAGSIIKGAVKLPIKAAAKSIGKEPTVIAKIGKFKDNYTPTIDVEKPFVTTVGKMKGKAAEIKAKQKAQEEAVESAANFLKIRDKIAEDKLNLAVAKIIKPDLPPYKLNDDHFEFLSIKENRDAVDDLIKTRIKESLEADTITPVTKELIESKLFLKEEEWLNSLSPTDYARLKFGKENLDPKDLAFYSKKEKEAVKNIKDTKKYELTLKEIEDYEKSPDFIKRQEKKRLAEEQALAKEKDAAIKEAESFDKAEFLEKDRLKAKETQDYIKAQKDRDNLLKTVKDNRAKRDAAEKKATQDIQQQNRNKRLSEAEDKRIADAESLLKTKDADYEKYLLKQLADAQKNKNPEALAYWKKFLDEHLAKNKVEKGDDFLTKVEKNVEDDGKFGGENKIGTRPNKDPLPKKDTGDKGTEVKFDESKSSAPTKDKLSDTGEKPKKFSYYTKKLDSKTYNELLANPTAFKVNDIIKKAFASASTYYGTPQSKEDFKAWQTPDGKLGVSYESSDSPSFEVILATGNEIILDPLPKADPKDKNNPFKPWTEIPNPKATNVVVPKTIKVDKDIKKPKAPQKKDTSIKIPDEMALAKGKIVGNKILVEIPKPTKFSELITTKTPDITRITSKSKVEEKIEDPEKAKAKDPKEEPEKAKIEEKIDEDGKPKGKVVKEKGKSKTKIKLPKRKKIKDIKLDKPNQYGYLFTWQQGNQYPVANLLTNKVRYTRVRPRNLPMGNTVAETFTVLKSSKQKPQVRRLDIGKFFANISRGGVQFELKKKNLKKKYKY